jgi:hypothetical protein
MASSQVIAQSGHDSLQLPCKEAFFTIKRPTFFWIELLENYDLSENENGI